MISHIANRRTRIHGALPRNEFSVVGQEWMGFWYV